MERFRDLLDSGAAQGMLFNPFTLRPNALVPDQHRRDGCRAVAA
jgi:hypothetical protein